MKSIILQVPTMLVIAYMLLVRPMMRKGENANGNEQKTNPEEQKGKF